MFIGKKKKIQRYLEQKAENEKTVFDLLLSDYLTDKMKEDLTSIGIRKIEIYVDWLEDIKCIAVQGCYEEYYMDLQIDPNEFSVSFDLDEADEDTVYSLESKEQVYNVLSETIKTLK